MYIAYRYCKHNKYIYIKIKKAYIMYMHMKEIISANLRRIIKARGLKVSAAGRLCGYDSHTEYRNFYNYCKGTREPDPTNLKKIAAGLGVTLDDLTSLSGISVLVRQPPHPLPESFSDFENDIAIAIATIVWEKDMDVEKEQILAWAKEFCEKFTQPESKNKKPPLTAIEIFVDNKVA